MPRKATDTWSTFAIRSMRLQPARNERSCVIFQAAHTRRRKSTPNAVRASLAVDCGDGNQVRTFHVQHALRPRRKSATLDNMKTPSNRIQQLQAMQRGPMLGAKIVQSMITELLTAYPDLKDDEVLRADTIEGETIAFEFIGRLVRLVGDTQAMQAGIHAYRVELAERQERYERRELALRALMFKVMQTADLQRAELPEATVTVRAGTPKVVIVDEELIPKHLQRVKVEPDKTKIKAALQANQDVPGAVLSNAEPTIAIRIK
jgi:Siphovirus Gp157